MFCYCRGDFFVLKINKNGFKISPILLEKKCYGYVYKVVCNVDIIITTINQLHLFLSVFIIMKLVGECKTNDWDPQEGFACF